MTQAKMLKYIFSTGTLQVTGRSEHLKNTYVSTGEEGPEPYTLNKEPVYALRSERCFRIQDI